MDAPGFWERLCERLGERLAHCAKSLAELQSQYTCIHKLNQLFQPTASANSVPLDLSVVSEDSFDLSS